MTESSYNKLFKDFDVNGALVHFSEQCKDQKAYTDELERQESILSAVSTQAMKDEFSSAFALINMVVYVVLVLAAMLFHKSAFIMFIIYPIFHIKITPNKMLILAPAILFIYIFNESIFGFLLRIMGDKYEEQYGELQATGAIMMIVLFAILVFFAFVIPEEDKMEKETVGLRNMLVICLVLQLFSPVSTVAMRMNYYFLPFVPVLIPKIINRSKQQYRQVAMLATAVLVLFFVIRFFFTASTGADILQIFPYKFYFE